MNNYFLDFSGSTIHVAKKLLGKALILETDHGPIGGIINEVEAYTEEDPACHAYLGKKTKRNKMMFQCPGTIYIYMIYGMYYCLNIVTEEAERGCAVLIRSIIPKYNIAIMKKNRNDINNTKDISNGPAKLFQALSLNHDLNGFEINKSKLKIYDLGITVDNFRKTSRIGISKGIELPWRFVY